MRTDLWQDGTTEPCCDCVMVARMSCGFFLTFSTSFGWETECRLDALQDAPTYNCSLSLLYNRTSLGSPWALVGEKQPKNIIGRAITKLNKNI